MIMVLPQMAVLVSDLPVIEPVSLSKPEAADQFQGVSYKLAGVVISSVVKGLDQFAGGNMVFGLEEGFENVVSIFKSIDLFLMEELFKLFLFLAV